MDIVIPYGGNGESIKYALRSIEKYINYDNVFVVTSEKCEHLNHKNIIFVHCEDSHKHNKDANLFDKVLTACGSGLGEEFLFWSDDQAALMEHDIQHVFNIRDPLKMQPTCKWEQRLVRTGMFIKEFFGRNMGMNFDSHVPQIMKRNEFMKIGGIDYKSGLGFTICTLYFGIAGWFDRELVEQRTVKATFEGGYFNGNDILKKHWVGWDSETYKNANLRNLLEKLFPYKSKFEA